MITPEASAWLQQHKAEREQRQAELLAIRTRTDEAAQGQHQSLQQTEADREALLRMVDRLRASLANARADQPGGGK